MGGENIAEEISYQEKCKNPVSVATAGLKVFACICFGFLILKATKTVSKEMDNGNIEIAKEIIGKIPGMLKV